MGNFKLDIKEDNDSLTGSLGIAEDRVDELKNVLIEHFEDMETAMILDKSGTMEKVVGWAETVNELCYGLFMVGGAFDSLEKRLKMKAMLDEMGLSIEDLEDKLKGLTDENSDEDEDK